MESQAYLGPNGMVLTGSGPLANAGFVLANTGRHVMLPAWWSDGLDICKALGGSVFSSYGGSSWSLPWCSLPLGIQWPVAVPSWDARANAILLG